MSTNILENERGFYITVFACGKCRETGPCFQLTTSIPDSYIIVHRNEAKETVKAISKELKRK